MLRREPDGDGRPHGLRPANTHAGIAVPAGWRVAGTAIPALAPVDFGSETGPVTVGLGQEFLISVRGKSTTGLQWLPAGPLEESTVRILGRSFLSDATPTPEQGRPSVRVVGPAVIEVIRCRAVGEGSATISLKYAQPWEEDIPDPVTHSLAVVVQ